VIAGPADWTAVGEKKGDRFGSAVSTAGDVDGDGKSDVVVGAHGYDDSLDVVPPPHLGHMRQLKLSLKPGQTVRQFYSSTPDLVVKMEGGNDGYP
jgi:hypothetical protein